MVSYGFYSYTYTLHYVEALRCIALIFVGIRSLEYVSVCVPQAVVGKSGLYLLGIRRCCLSVLLFAIWF